MTPHVLACGLCSGGSHAPTSPWTVAAFLIVAALAALVAWNRHKAGLPPIGTGMSPNTRSLLSGRNIPSYTASFTAVTPSGTLVRHARCCYAGHQLPEQAIAHAEAIAKRIGRCGRVTTHQGEEAAMTERKERGGYASGDKTASELPPPPPSVTVKDVPTEPRQEWAFPRQEFERALGIPQDWHISTIYVDAREIRVILWPRREG